MSQEPCPIHATPNGRLLLVADGPELLVYDAMGRPLFKQFLDGILADLTSLSSLLCTLDTEGTVRWLQSHDGSVQASVQGAPAVGLCAGSGRLASYGPSGIQWLSAGAAPTQGISEALTGAAFSHDGTRLGVALEAGHFWSLDPTTGGSWGQVALGGTPGAVVWSTRAWFVVVVGNLLHQVAADGSAILGTLALPGAADAVALSPDGVVVAARVGNTVVLGELHSHQLAGQVTFRRAVKAIDFAPDGRLVVGLDDGDANFLDLYTGASKRTEPHPGRGRNNWNYDAEFDMAALRGAVAHAQAGGAPIARFIGPPEQQRTWARTCLAVFLMWSLVCCGCSGLTALFYAAQSM